MKNRKKYEIWLVITYIAIVAVFVYLSFFSGSRAGGIANLIVNTVMLLIAGIILVSAYIGSLRPVMKIIDDLKRVIEKIDDDAKHTHRFLWEKYKEEKDELFEEEILKEEFKDYRYELNRILHMEKSYYKCDIEDYINYELIDSVIHRNRMNQIAGVMTGLGILGTFIGLSLGLQNFNTGSTAEVTNSIDPLMAGIKVAFHTSIYGMVFSLVFNWVYKRVLDDAETAVSKFINTYKKYVMPDATPDSINRLIDLEQQQTEAVVSLSQNMTHLISNGLRELLEPQFNRLDDTITGFANMATKNQMDQLTVVVNAFVNEMNRSLNNVFTSLSETIDRTLVAQSANEKQMQEIFDKNLTIADNVDAIAQRTGEVSEALRVYVGGLDNLQKQVNNNVEILQNQRAQDSEVIDKINNYITEIEEYRGAIKEALDMTDASLKMQNQMLNEIRETTREMPSDVRETFDVINNNLQIVENHFKDTIEQIQRVLSQMSGTIDYSYRGIEDGFVRTAKSIDELAGFMQRLENYYTGR
ncbi:MAG: MotA/TolQ/ExbB proton channel family protein [Lachnospiraceae bacterium]|nr:MotA/TolQ/ExbB proton channel family protein [Lachnospiraceae bacterium]